MKKKCFVFGLVLFSLTQITFATENDLNSVPQPVTLIINDSDQKLINFNLDKTAILELPADPVKKTASIKLAPANRDRELLLSCNNNQRITGDQSVNCPVSSSLVTQVKLTDVTPVKKQEMTKPELIGGIVAVATGGVSVLAVAGGCLVGVVVGGLTGIGIGSYW